MFEQRSVSLTTFPKTSVRILVLGNIPADAYNLDTLATLFGHRLRQGLHPDIVSLLVQHTHLAAIADLGKIHRVRVISRITIILEGLSCDFLRLITQQGVHRR
ncbi:hypothetical protein D3C74_410200 [compost metagenome]